MHQPGRFLLYFCLCGIILGGALLLQPGRALYGAGCTDVYDDNGNRVDTLTDHPVLAAVPAQISRSLCGFYDADYVEFPAEPGVAYHIQVLNHEDPARYGLYLELWEQQAPDQNHLLLSTAQGSVELTSPTTFTGNLVVRIGSLRSDTGSYGGGDYSLAITRQRSPQATPTVTPTRQPTTVPTVTATTAPTMTPTTTPTATPIITPIITPTTTPTTKSPVMLSWRLLLPICLQSRLLERAY